MRQVNAMPKPCHQKQRAANAENKAVEMLTKAATSVVVALKLLYMYLLIKCPVHFLAS